jgi:hypothetical protein
VKSNISNAIPGKSFMLAVFAAAAAVAAAAAATRYFTDIYKVLL